MKTTKRIVSMVLVLVTLCSVLAIPTFAASWPSLSSSGYAEMVSHSDLAVYRNTSLTTRGTCSPVKSYNAYVSRNDKIYIYQVTGSYTKLSYPTSSGRRTGYVKTKDLLGVTSPTESFYAKAKLTTYTNAGLSSKSGSTAAGDAIYKLGTTSNAVLILYTAVSGSRAYKAAFISKADYEKLKGNSSELAMSYALYQSSGGWLSCGFDGYVTTNGRHEGIDFKKSNGSAVYSLTEGVVTRITEGYRGSNGLSTIAIYSSATGKTVVYLHSDPLNSLYVGQQISRGQQIAVEDWRGCSSASGGHTHVEVREGRRTAAAKSVNDNTLDNANPTAFWNGQGYQVK